MATATAYSSPFFPPKYPISLSPSATLSSSSTCISSTGISSTCISSSSSKSTGFSISSTCISSSSSSKSTGFSISSTGFSISISSSSRQRQVAVSVSFNPQGNNDLSLLDHYDDQASNNVPTPLPPKEGRLEVVLENELIRNLDLSPFNSVTAISPVSSSSVSVSVSDSQVEMYLERTVGFTINYAREDPYDQRELSELPDIRLWFVRLDAAYPWLPVLLDWRAGELARYAAMLVPHQMSLKMGVVFNPEALELFIMKKVFIVYSWLKRHGISTAKAKLKTSDMARMLGFGIGDELFDLIDQHPL